MYNKARFTLRGLIIFITAYVLRAEEIYINILYYTLVLIKMWNVAARYMILSDLYIYSTYISHIMKRLCCGLQHPHTIISHISLNALPSALKGQDFSGTRKNWNERSNLPFWIYFLHMRTASSCSERQAGKHTVSNWWWSGRNDNQKHTTKVHKTKKTTTTKSHKTSVSIQVLL